MIIKQFLCLLEILHRLCLTVGHARDVFNTKQFVSMINFAAVVSDNNRYYQKAWRSKKTLQTLLVLSTRNLLS